MACVYNVRVKRRSSRWRDKTRTTRRCKAVRATRDVRYDDEVRSSSAYRGRRLALTALSSAPLARVPFDCFSLRGHRARARLPSLARSSAPPAGGLRRRREREEDSDAIGRCQILVFEKRRDITFLFIFIFRLLIGLNRGGVKVRPRSWLEGHAGSRGHAVVGRVLVLADWESRSHRSGTARAHGFSNVFHPAFDWRCDRRCDERRQ